MLLEVNEEGFHGYFVDELGNVFSNKRGNMVKLKQQKTKNGYMKICLHENGCVITRSVHRIVAKAFIPNPNNYPIINHIDGNKSNNNVLNLEWCDNSKNQKHAYSIGLQRRITGKDRWNSKPVVAIRKSDNKIFKFSSMHEASVETGCSERNIFSHCHNKKIPFKNNSSSKYRFVFEEDFDYSKLDTYFSYEKSSKKIFFVDIISGYIGIFNSVSEASRNTGASRCSIQKQISGKIKNIRKCKYYFEEIYK